MAKTLVLILATAVVASAYQADPGLMLKEIAGADLTAVDRSQPARFLRIGLGAPRQQQTRPPSRTPRAKDLTTDAGEIRPLATLPVPYEDNGACPFEGCTYGRWRAEKATPVFKDPKVDSPVSFSVAPGERVTAVTGKVVITLPGKFKVLRPVRFGNSNLVAQSGEIISILTYQGEGYSKAWFRGYLIDALGLDAPHPNYPMGIPGEMMQRPKSVWWVQLKNKTGQLGWTNQADNFSGKDRFSGETTEVVPGGKLGQFLHGTLVEKRDDKTLVVASSPAAATHTHPGVDIAADCGEPIHPISDGYAVDIIDNGKDRDFPALGYMVLVKHAVPAGGRETYSIYLHMHSPPKVSMGEHVERGFTELGFVGQTGAATGCHVHFEVRHFATRFLTDPEWNAPWNIYGKGDQRNTKRFLDNWEDPVSDMGDIRTQPDKGGGERGSAAPISEDVIKPSLIHRVEPEYTEEARQANVQGIVELSVVVDVDGSVRDVRVVRGLGYGLDEKAVAAVKQCKFRPGTKDGRPVPVPGTVKVAFKRF